MGGEEEEEGMRRGQNLPFQKKTGEITAQQTKNIAFRTSRNNVRGEPAKVKGKKR